MTRLRVAMFLKEGITFEEDWARSVALHVDLIAIKSVRRIGVVSPVAGALATYGLHVPRLRPTRVLAIARRRLWMSRVTALLRRVQQEHGRLDLLHAHFYPMGGLMRRLRAAEGLPYALTEHSTRLTGRSAAHKPLSKAGVRIAERSYRDAEIVFFPSAYLRDCVERLGLSGPFVVVGNPIDTHAFRPRATNRREPRVVWVGRLESDKDPLTAFQGFEIAHRRLPELRLDVVGGGPDRRHLERWIRDRRLEKSVTLWGRQPRPVIADLLSQSVVFLSSSSVETFGVAVAEALSSGIPVVAPAVPPLDELVRPSCGVLCPPRDVGAMADALIEIVTARDRFTSGSIAEEVRTRFSLDSIGAKVAHAYEDALAVCRAA